MLYIAELVEFTSPSGINSIFVRLAAHLGKDIRLNKDATGDAFGERLYAAAKAGSGEVTYKFPKAGADKTPVPKVSFVTAVAGLGCGVGYYP